MTKLYDVTRWRGLRIDERSCPLIGIVDAVPAIGRILDVDGRKFSVHVLGKGYAGVRPLTTELNTSPEAKEFEQNIVCPYCGMVNWDSFECSDEDTTECMECGGTIHYQRIVTIEYTTEPVKPPKPIRAQWIKDVSP